MEFEFNYYSEELGDEDSTRIYAVADVCYYYEHVDQHKFKAQNIEIVALFTYSGVKIDLKTVSKFELDRVTKIADDHAAGMRDL